MAELDDIISEPSEAEKRIKQLSDKVRQSSEERDAALAASQTAQAEATDKIATVERERDFYANFSDVVAGNPQAKDHKDEILEKVKGGYTVEDATYAVLGKAGKLGNAPETSSPAGGSASTALPQGGEKQIADMTQDERRTALTDALQIT